MSSLATPDDRFDQAEADVDHGTAWRYREPDAPNPLTIVATGWSTGVTKIGDPAASRCERRLPRLACSSVPR